MNRNPLGWFEIPVKDMARATRFYESVLDIRLSPLDDTQLPESFEMMGFPMDDTGYGASGALVTQPEAAGNTPGVTVYFQCDDCAEQSARVVASGGMVVQPKLAIGRYGFIAMVEDSEGNLIGLHSRQ